MSVETDRLISGKPTSAQEEQFEGSLHPATLAEYVGQALDHVLLFAPLGQGATHDKG